jgi:histidinol dehydrogenase
MKFVSYPKIEDWQDLLKRPTQTVEDIEDTVKQIFSEVDSKGDEAIKKYTELFDGIKLNQLEVSNLEIKESESLVSEELKQAITLAKSNIEVFHKAQRTQKNRS